MSRNVSYLLFYFRVCVPSPPTSSYKAARATLCCLWCQCLPLIYRLRFFFALPDSLYMDVDYNILVVGVLNRRKVRKLCGCKPRTARYTTSSPLCATNPNFVSSYYNFKWTTCFFYGNFVLLLSLVYPNSNIQVLYLCECE